MSDKRFLAVETPYNRIVTRKEQWIDKVLGSRDSLQSYDHPAKSNELIRLLAVDAPYNRMFTRKE